MTTGQRQLDEKPSENMELSALDVWTHVTLTFLFLLFIEFTLVRTIIKMFFSGKSTTLLLIPNIGIRYILYFLLS